MKKIFTLFLALIGITGTASAQDYEFQMDGKSLPDGSTITIEAGMNDWGSVECNTNPSAQPNLVMFKKLTADATMEGTATIEIQQNTMEAEIISWCMGGNCVPIMRTTYTKKFTFESTDLYPVIDNAIKLSYDAQHQVLVCRSDKHQRRVGRQNDGRGLLHRGRTAAFCTTKGSEHREAEQR